MTREVIFLAFAVSAAIGVAPAIALFKAGRLEAGGRFDEARAGARRHGLRLAGHSILCAVAALILGSFSSTGLFLAAGAVSLLTGLSRKPRPSGSVAVCLFCLGVAAASAFSIFGDPR